MSNIDQKSETASSETVGTHGHASHNLIFVLDISSSMDTQDAMGGQSRIDILKNSLNGQNGLLDKYDVASEHLHITFVPFNNEAHISPVFTDVDSAKAFVEGLTPNGSTNYVDALVKTESVITNDALNPTLGNYINRIYFISDGDPYPALTYPHGNIPNHAQYSTWQHYLDNHVLPLSSPWDAVAINIGTASDMDLMHIVPHGDPFSIFHVASDLHNLQEVLLGTLNRDMTASDPFTDQISHHTLHTEYQHNLLDNAADPQSTKVVGLSFDTPNGEQYISDNFLYGLNATVDPNGKTVHIPLNDQQTDLTVTTPIGATLHLDQYGHYTYDIGAAHSTGSEHFTYTVQDLANGHTQDAVLEMNVVVLPDQLISLIGSTGIHDPISGTSSVSVLSHENGGDQYIVDISSIQQAEKIVIMDLGISKHNILTFTGANPVHGADKLSLADVVSTFETDGNNVTMTLHNNALVVLQNIGQLENNSDLNALEEHLLSITQEFHILK